jgi:hypothetical protein
MKRPPLRIFFCYAHADRDVRRALDSHLDLLEREGLVAPWFDGRIEPGTEWSDVIEQNLRAADLIVFLISPASSRPKTDSVAEGAGDAGERRNRSVRAATFRTAATDAAPPFARL